MPDQILNPTPTDNTPGVGEDKSLLGEGVTPPVEPEPDKAGTEPPAGTEKPKEGEEAPQGAPEVYSDFILPEGVTIDEEIVAEAKTLFKEANLTQEQAQKTIDLQLKLETKRAEQEQAAWAKQVEEWKTETITALGADYQKKVAVAVKALDQFGGPELRELIDRTAVGSNVHFVKFCIAVGEKVADDVLVVGGEKPNSTVPMYDKSPLLK